LLNYDSLIDSDQQRKTNRMRKLISALFISLDGVVESPDKWSFDHFDEGMGVELQSQLDEQDAVLMGRVTYGEWATYWPTSTDEPFASYINNTPKYVFSKSLDNVAEWKNTTLLKGDLAAEINKLKAQSGKNIGTAGSPSLVQSLLEHNLVDELRLAVYPVIAGGGKRLFKDESALKRLKLVRATPTSTGVVMLVYQPR
jgi:dihydrofolate reductase